MTCIEKGLLSPAAKPTAKFIFKMNNLFDILNSSTPYSTPGKEAITQNNVETKFNILEKSKEWIKSWKFSSPRGDKNSMPFQKGWLITIENFEMAVLHCFNNEFNYIGMRKFNQDCIEVSTCR